MEWFNRVTDFLIPIRDRLLLPFNPDPGLVLAAVSASDGVIYTTGTLPVGRPTIRPPSGYPPGYPQRAPSIDPEEAAKRIKAQQLALARRKMEEYERKQFFSMFTEGITLIEGKKGTGKSLTGVTVAYNLRELFGMPVLADFKFKPPFGPYQYLDEPTFVREFSKITDVARDTSKDDVTAAADWALNKMGIMLKGAVILWDEAYKYFNSRYPMSKINRIYTYFIDQSRHYHNAIILMTPSRRRIDYKVLEQVDRLVKVAYSPMLRICFVRVLDYDTGDTMVKKIWAPRYQAMYDSWGAVAMSSNLFNIGKV